MATPAQSLANRANAQFSTGPRTVAGKTVSSLNSLKHGLTAATVLLPGEDSAVYQSFTDGMFAAFDPLDTAEVALVLELIDVQWRIRRGSRFEARILSAESPDMKALNNLGLHTARLKRHYSATLKEFQQLHRASRQRRNEQLQEAEQIHRADLLLERHSTFANFGFDFTLPDLESWMARKEALDNAQDTLLDFEYGVDEDLPEGAI